MHTNHYLVLLWSLWNSLCWSFEELSITGLEGVKSFWPPKTYVFPELSSRILQRRHIGRKNLPDVSEQKILHNFQVTQPPVVPQGGKSCRQIFLQTTFGNSFGKPARSSYSPPKDCGPVGSWASVILTLNASSQGTQYDRLSSIFLNGVEIMRTSTPEPLPGGISWTIEKDVTKYIPLFALPTADLVMWLDNIIDESKHIDGKFNAELSGTFYMPTAKFPTPILPDTIIPISRNNSATFSVPKAATIDIQIPENTVSAFVEIYASGADEEEFWYTDCLEEAATVLSVNSRKASASKGPFREVQLWIDNRLAGVAYPFPVIFTGGLLLTWWRPMAPYGSMEQPTYTIDVTPFLPLLTDSKAHNFTLSVTQEGINNSTNSQWYLSGNIACILNPSGKRTTGKIHHYRTEPKLHTSGGICDRSVHTTVDASRKLFIESYINVNGEEKKVSFQQDLIYQNKQNLAVDGSTQEVTQLSTGSSISKSGSLVTFSDEFSFPLILKIKNSAKGLIGEINLNYNRRIKPGLLNWFSTSIQTSQIASATLDLDETSSRGAGGQGRTSQIFSYTDERGSTFNRDVSVRNLTQILKDEISGSLAI